MNHAPAWLLLDRFLDAELEAPERWAVAAHVAGCSVCAAYISSQARLRMVTRDYVSTITAPSDLRNRVHAVLVEEADPQPVQSRPRYLRAIAAGAGVLVLLLMLTLGLWQLLVRSNDVSSQLAYQHRTFAHDEHAVKITGGPDTIERWLQHQVNFAVTVPEVTGYELLGGRIAMLSGRPAAHLIYEDEPSKQYLSLFFIANGASDPEGKKPLVVRRGGETIVIWRTPTCEASLVSDLPPSQAVSLAAHLQR
jgi:anti-sigma factor RsiW